MCMFVFIDADGWDLIVCGFASAMPKKEVRKSSLKKESAI